MPSTERSPLVQPATNSVHYDATPKSQDAEEDNHKLSHNRVGLSATRFWLLCLSMWVCGFLNAFDGTVGE
ncbi:hypothetical protein IAU59_004678 [Kwoniella sp. CBS 9459]